MNIEQRLAEAIRSFHLDALAGAVPLNVDLDVVLSVLAHTICTALRRRLPDYATATPDILQRRFLQTGGVIINNSDETIVRLDRRAYSPVLRQADLPTVTVPWWGNRKLSYQFAWNWGRTRCAKIGANPSGSGPRGAPAADHSRCSRTVPLTDYRACWLWADASELHRGRRFAWSTSGQGLMP